MNPHTAEIEWLDVRTASIEDLAPFVAHEQRMQLERLPEDPPIPLEERIQSWRNSPEFLELGCWVARSLDEPAIIANVWTEIWHTGDNEHVVFVNILVESEHRRKGIGRALLARIAAYAEERGRTLMIGETSDRVPAGPAFMQRIGAQSGLESKTHQLVLDEVDRALLRSWIERGESNAARYELGFFDGAYPEEEIGRVAAIFSAANNTEPRGSLEVEDEHTTPAQIRATERELAARGTVRWIAYVQERATRQFVGYTETQWNPNRPALLFQYGTAVLPEHRRQGLGRWLKGAMLERVLRERPEVRFVRTGNADVNAPMLKINNELGFRPLTVDVLWQIRLAGVQAYLASLHSAASAGP